MLFLLRDLFHWSASAAVTDILEDLQDFGINGFRWSSTDYWALVDSQKIFSADADNDIFYFCGTLK
jgi:hypothetical protein